MFKTNLNLIKALKLISSSTYGSVCTCECKCMTRYVSAFVLIN